tara:strand:- start:1216 stop:1566 length:351 start_codon:yes stop_codon:yes gene_type:complete
MKVLNITGYNFSNPDRVFYNGVSEAEILKKLNLVEGRTLSNSYLGNLTDWRNYKKILVSFKEQGFTHVTNDDDSVDIYGNVESKFEDPIDNEIQHVIEGIEYALSLRGYDSTPTGY